MSGLCKDCKWFFTDLNPDEGICYLLGDWPYKFIDEPDLDTSHARAHAVPFLSPGGSPYAAFQVPSDWGCIQFENEGEEPGSPMR